MALVSSFRRCSLYLNSLSRLLNSQIIQHRHYADGQGMSFTFASPGQLFYNNSDIRQVDVPSFSGDFGILPNHVPTLAVIKPGVVTVFEKDGTAKKFFVSSGSISVNDDSSVQVLAEEAVLLENLDPQACREGLTKAQSDLVQASTEVAKAEAQIKIEVHEALIKAVA